jgi:hypothetical protein
MNIPETKKFLWCINNGLVTDPNDDNCGTRIRLTHFKNHWEYLLAITHSDPFISYPPAWRYWEERLVKMQYQWEHLRHQHS